MNYNSYKGTEDLELKGVIIVEEQKTTKKSKSVDERVNELRMKVQQIKEQEKISLTNQISTILEDLKIQKSMWQHESEKHAKMITADKFKIEKLTIQRNDMAFLLKTVFWTSMIEIFFFVAIKNRSGIYFWGVVLMFVWANAFFCLHYLPEKNEEENQKE